MRIYVKTLSGKTFVMEVEGSTSMESLKRRIMKEYGLWIGFQRLIFAGKLMENDRTIADYNMSQECTVHVVVRIGNLNPDSDFFCSLEYPSFPWELRNYARLRRLKRMKDFEPPKKILSQVPTIRTEITLFAKHIIPSGKFGPLSIILSFIDVIELLHEHLGVCKTFYDCIFHIISTKGVTWKPIHLYILFSYTVCVSEPLFLKLAKILKNDHGLDLRKIEVPLTPLRAASFEDDGDNSNLMYTAIQRRYFESVKYLHDVGKFGIEDIRSKISKDSCDTPVVPSSIHSSINNQPGKKSLELINYIIEKYTLNKKHGDWDFQLIKELMLSKRWDFVLKLVEKDPSRSFLGPLMKEFSRVTEEDCLDVIIPVEVFNKLLEHGTKHPSLFSKEDLQPRHLRILPWEAIKKFVCKKEELERNDRMIRLWTEYLDVLEEKVGLPFFRFCAHNHEKMMGKVYLPRIQLYIAGIEGNSPPEVAKIKLNEYKEADDNHYGKDYKGKFGFFRYELLNSPEIASLLLDSGKLPLSISSLLKILESDHHPLKVTIFSKQFVRDFLTKRVSISGKSSYYKNIEGKERVNITKIVEVMIKKYDDEEQAEWVLKNPFDIILPRKEVGCHTFGYDIQNSHESIIETSLKCGHEAVAKYCIDVMTVPINKNSYSSSILKTRFEKVIQVLFSLVKQCDDQDDETSEELKERCSKWLVVVFDRFTNGELKFRRKYCSGWGEHGNLTIRDLLTRMMVYCVVFENVHIARKVLECKDWSNDLFIKVLGEKVEKRKTAHYVCLLDLREFLLRKRHSLGLKDDPVIVECVDCQKLVNVVEDDDFVAVTVCSKKKKGEKEPICFDCLVEIQENMKFNGYDYN